MIDAVDECGPVDIEAAQVGIFFKTSRSIIQIRPKPKRLELSLVLARPVVSDRVRRSVTNGSRIYVFTDLRTPADVDDWIHELIFEAYDLHPRKG